MSAAKHTPGPWRVGTSGPNLCPTIGTMRGLMVAMVAHGHEHPTQANARLIAAAPDLLEEARTDLQAWENALELCLIPERHRDTALARIERLRTAIAKATT